PWIRGGLRSPECAPDEIEDENQLTRSQHERAIRHEDIERLKTLHEDVLSWIVIVPDHSADTENMHRQEDQICSDNADLEVNLPEALIHHSSEHAREPVIDCGKSRE